MIIAKVTYTVRAEFAQKNQENINLFMEEFKKLNRKEYEVCISYIAFLFKATSYICCFEVWQTVLQGNSYWIMSTKMVFLFMTLCWKYPLHIITLPLLIQNHIYNLLYFLIKLYNEKY